MVIHVDAAISSGWKLAPLSTQFSSMTGRLLPTPACVTPKVSPATWSQPMRGATLVLAAAVNCSGPLPTRTRPARTDSHGDALVASQGHADPVVTETVPVVSADPTCRP